MRGVEVVAVVGLGKMGSGIAQILAQSGCRVRAVDEGDSAVKKGVEAIRSGRFGLERAVEKGLIRREEAEEALARITATTDLAGAVAEADLVVEAIFEDLNLKKGIFKRLDEAAPERAVLATNTSGLSITEIASATGRPGRVVGMHFFNPPQVMKLVEIVRGLLTSDEAVRAVNDLALRVGKTPITIRDSPGFATSRLGLALYLEASRVLEEGVAGVRDLDMAMRLGYGHPIGPFELAELVGLDTRLSILEALHHSTGDPRWRPPTLLRMLVRAGYLGDPKVHPGSKGGYYEYFKQPRPRGD